MSMLQFRHPYAHGRPPLHHRPLPHSCSRWASRFRTSRRRSPPQVALYTLQVPVRYKCLKCCHVLCVGLGADVTPQSINSLAVWMIENPLAEASPDVSVSGVTASDTTTPDVDTPHLLEMTTVRAPIVRERCSTYNVHTCTYKHSGVNLSNVQSLGFSRSDLDLSEAETTTPTPGEETRDILDPGDRELLGRSMDRDFERRPIRRHGGRRHVTTDIRNFFSASPRHRECAPASCRN